MDRFSKEDIDAIIRVNGIIKEKYYEALSIKRLAGMVYLNIDKLKTGYKEIYGTTVHEAVIARKMEIGYNLLAYKRTTVKDAAYSVGYSNQGHFINLFRRYYGITPGALLNSLREKSYADMVE